MATRVLVVDDCDVVMDVVREALVGDYEVTCACDWAEAASAIFRRGVDVVLLDVNLPVVGGEAIAEALKNANFMGKVVLHSAMDEGELRNMARSVGAVGYLVKPADAARIRAVVDRHAPPARRPGPR